ncbi:hypothetical protein [Fructobacillus tropaeoli]|uniref:hypothetical protein n=1 Tax=Fructobacillus tropaeoli TaxID=709323 RepID=UPI0030C7CA76
MLEKFRQYHHFILLVISLGIFANAVISVFTNKYEFARMIFAIILAIIATINLIAQRSYQDNRKK